MIRFYVDAPSKLRAGFDDHGNTRNMAGVSGLGGMPSKGVGVDDDVRDSATSPHKNLLVVVSM